MPVVNEVGMGSFCTNLSIYCFEFPHLMMTSSNGNISLLLVICAGNSTVPAQRQVTRSFDVFFDLRLNKRFNKQSWGWWFETLSHPLWRHRNAYYASALFWLQWFPGLLFVTLLLGQISRRITHLSQLWTVVGILQKDLSWITTITSTI